MSSLTNQKIVVPWDFSEHSKKALDQAMDLAQSPQQIDVVHVTSYEANIEPAMFWHAKSEDSIRHEVKQVFLNSVPKELAKQVTFVSLFGDPGREVTRYAKQVYAGLIIVSSHGRSGISKILMGSVAERIVRLAPCPVLVLRSESNEKSVVEDAA